MRLVNSLWRVALVACASVCLSASQRGGVVMADAPVNKGCFEMPIVIVSPTVKPFPINGCKNPPGPSENCLKERIEVDLEIVDKTAAANGSVALNCMTDTPTSVHPSAANYRGQSSLGFAKHQFSINLHEAAPFLGFPEDTSFVLNGPHIDGSLIRNHLAQWMFRSTGRYSPKTRHIIVFVRDLATKKLDYMGVYVALEKISYGPNRVGLAPLDNTCNTSELNGGWAWQLNPLNFGVYSPNVIVDQYQLMFGSGARPVLMYPEPEVLTQTIRDYFVTPSTGPLPQLYRHLYNNMTDVDDLEKVIDIGSFVDYMLHSELSQNTDAYRRSTYFFKDRNQPINAGPVWDFNLAYGTGSNQPAWLFERHLLWKRLLTNYKFATLTIKRWRQLRGSVWSDESIETFIDDATEPLKHQFAECLHWYGDQMPCANVNVGGTYQANIDRVKNAIHGRAKWIDEHVGQFYTKLVDTKIWGTANNLPMYNCAANGEDDGCLTNPEKYLAAIEFPPVRKPNQAPPCSLVKPVEEPSIDPCWMSVGSGTTFCSGNGYCPMGPGAKCKCINGKAPPTCGDVAPPAVDTILTMSTMSKAQGAIVDVHNAPQLTTKSIRTWSSASYSVVMVCGVMVALVAAHRRRSSRGPSTNDERVPFVTRP